MVWSAAVGGVFTEHFRNANQLVVLRRAVATAGRSGLDLSGIARHGEVGDEGVFGLAASVTDDRVEATVLGKSHGVHRF